MSVTLENAERRADETARRFFSPARFERAGLTGVRALAACLVMGFHLNALVGPKRMYLGFDFARVEVTHLLTIGWVGVNVFFVLSGFLLAIHLFERMQDRPRSQVMRSYLRARVLRIVPAYWARIFISLAIAWIVLGEHPPWTRYVPAHLVLVHEGSYKAHGTIDAVFWTLPVEFSFYLILPFAMAWIMRARPDGPAPRVSRAFAFAAAAVALAIAWRAMSFAVYGDRDLGKLFWLSTAQWPGLFDQFAIGMAAATLFVHLGMPEGERDRRWARLGDAIAIAGLAGLIGLMYLMHVLFDRYWTGSWTFYLWNPAVGLSVAALIFGVAVHGPIARAAFANRLIVFVGTVSYSLYLWHAEIGDALSTHLGGAPRLGFWKFFAIAVPAVLAASALSYYFVERPFLRMKSRAQRA
jgi:peptidoglycan/LPS O-acetylase OafA/YrhL